jgi:NifU-like protein involved in Fe-S cluster formation
VSEAIYQQAIKDLVRQTHGSGHLATPDRRARLDNPLCGDRVEIEVRLAADGRIAELAHQTRGCLLCRAAASILGRRAPGQSPAQIAAVHAALTAMLAAGDPPPAAWREWECFLPVRAHRSRHGCVLLPLRALEAALQSNL